MQINNFLSTYELHDSLLTEVTVNENMLTLTIDFCYWMQNGYQDSDVETGKLQLCFSEISDYCGPLGEVDDFSILKAEYKNNIFSLLLLDDFNNQSSILCFCSDSGLVNIRT